MTQQPAYLEFDWAGSLSTTNRLVKMLRARDILNLIAVQLFCAANIAISTLKEIHVERFAQFSHAFL
jgi:hypothetical protein